MGRGNQTCHWLFRVRWLSDQPTLRRTDITLTLGWAICQAPSRHRMGYLGADVDDDTSLFRYSRTKSPFVWILRVDSIGNASVNDKGTECIDLEDLFECLYSKLRSKSCTHINTVVYLVGPWSTGRVSGTVNTSCKTAFGDGFQDS